MIQYITDKLLCLDKRGERCMDAQCAIDDSGYLPQLPSEVEAEGNAIFVQFVATVRDSMILKICSARIYQIR